MKVELTLTVDAAGHLNFRKALPGSTSDADFKAATKVAEGIWEDNRFPGKMFKDLDRLLPDLPKLTQVANGKIKDADKAIEEMEKVRDALAELLGR